MFPDCLILARDSTNAGNNRPISLLPIFSKIFEKVVHKQLFTYQNNILYEHQYGFKKTQVYCASIIESHVIYVRQHIDSCNFVITVFLVFKKAFDIVDHKILLSKFDFYGIRGVSHEWLKSHLSERNEITAIDGITSYSS